MTSSIIPELEFEYDLRVDTLQEQVESLKFLNGILNPKKTFGEKVIEFITDRVERPGFGASYNNGEVKVNYTLKF